VLDASKLDHSDRPETTEGHHANHNIDVIGPDQPEKTKISERLARLDADREKIATQLTDLETAERVLTRVSKTPRGRRPTSASAAEAKAAIATRGRGRPPRATTSKSTGVKPSA